MWACVCAPDWLSNYLNWTGISWFRSLEPLHCLTVWIFRPVFVYRCHDQFCLKDSDVFQSFTVTAQGSLPPPVLFAYSTNFLIVLCLNFMIYKTGKRHRTHSFAVGIVKNK